MRKSARRRTRGTRTRQDLLNEILRPNPYLGYAEDNIGAHLLECEAYETAERFFRQAVWVNPYEPQFRVHLARSLYDQRRYPEALNVLREVLASQPEFGPAIRLLERCEHDAASH